MLRCKDLVRLAASDELAEAPWKRRLGVRLHVLICRHCRRYLAQLGELRTVSRRSFETTSEDAEILGRLERRLLGTLPESSTGSGTSGATCETPSREDGERHEE